MEEKPGILIAKLDQFIRKFYRNELTRGAIYFTTAFLVFFLTVNILEYLGHFSSLVRTILFYSYLGINVLVFIRFIFIPMLGLFRIGKIISYEQAALIIGKHFPEVKDKLLNALQLLKISQSDTLESDLLVAGITQKINLLKPIPFQGAIRISENRKYLKYLAAPVILLLVVLVAAPGMIMEPSKRIVNYNRYFAKEFPFSVHILNHKLETVQQQDFQLDVKLDGQNIPAEVFVEIDGASFKMQRESTVLFHYTFKSIIKNTPFRLVANGFTSDIFELKIIPKPMILNFEVSLEYPAYTGKKNEVLENNGDLVVPEGTKATWKFYTRDAEELEMKVNGINSRLTNPDGNTFIKSLVLKFPARYSLVSRNRFMLNPDSLSYSISVIPDAYPSIEVDQFTDSVFNNRFYFSGIIRDDYGFSKLAFHYRIIDGATGDSLKVEQIECSITKNTTTQQFYHSLDARDMIANPGDKVVYYFEVWDNDAVNGSKSSRSSLMTYKVPTAEELEKQSTEASESLKDKMKDIIHDSREQKKQMDEFTKKLVDKESLSWMEKKQLQEFLEKQKELQQRVEQVQKENEIKDIRDQQYQQMDPSVVEKQKQLEELFKEVLTDEMKKTIDELKKMMENINKDKVNELMEKIKFNNEDLEKQMDRSLEVFRQLEFDKMFTEAMDKLNKLAEKQENLADETKEDGNKEKSKKLLEQQNGLNDEFKQLREDLNVLEKKNAELEDPMNMKNTDEQESAILEDMQNSSESLQKNKSQNASGKQKQAADKMKSLKQLLQDMQDEASSGQDAEDMGVLREILENLILLSFDQEELMKQVKNVKAGDPKYLKMVQDQKNLWDDLKMTRDSLDALAKRQPMIKPMITRELAVIDQNLGDVLGAMNDRTLGAATSKQQYVMTSLNNLALLLSEVLSSMEQNMNMQQQKGSGKGNKSCNNPGGKGKGKPSAANMKKLQEKLNQQLQQLKEEMGKQGKPGQSGQGNKPMSEKLARMAAQQEAIRQQMQQYSKDLKAQGINDGGNSANTIKQMEQTETELINKRISQEMMNRQQEILTRLLESEKAEKKRDFEEKRESTEGKDIKKTNPEKYFESKKGKESEFEMLKTIPPAFNSFYKNKVNEYFIRSGSIRKN